jgi:hypothetical protein
MKNLAALITVFSLSAFAGAELGKPAPDFKLSETVLSSSKRSVARWFGAVRTKPRSTKASPSTTKATGAGGGVGRASSSAPTAQSATMAPAAARRRLVRARARAARAVTLGIGISATREARAEATTCARAVSERSPMAVLSFRPTRRVPEPLVEGSPRLGEAALRGCKRDAHGLSDLGQLELLEVPQREGEALLDSEGAEFLKELLDLEPTDGASATGSSEVKRAEKNRPRRRRRSSSRTVLSVTATTNPSSAASWRMVGMRSSSLV